MAEIRRLLVPVDFSSSPSSEGAIDLAVTLARRFGAHMTLLHVVEMPDYAHGDLAVWMEMLARILDKVRDVLGALEDELRERVGGLPIESIALEGRAASEITRVARDGGLDLIVMGTRGRSGLQQVLLGSVAEEVVRTAHCPVATVRGGA